MLRWTVTKEDGGKDRAGQAVVAVGHQVYSFTDSESYSVNRIDVNVFNTVSLRWSTLPPVTTGRKRRSSSPSRSPSPRYSHTAVLIDHVVYILGGVTTWRGEDVSRKYCGVLYAFNVDTHRWFIPDISGTVPDLRFLHSACALGKVMYIHGGIIQKTGYMHNPRSPYWKSNDLFKLDTTSMVWTLINTRGTPPLLTSGHSATIIGTKMFVFGGSGHLRVFDIETNLWLDKPAQPEVRYDHSAFTYNEELYILGGHNGCQSFNDLWRFNPETLSWRKVAIKGKPPPFPGMFRPCCCMLGDRIFIFGGYRDDGGSTTTPVLLNDLHILDLSPSLKTLCMLAVIQYGVEQSGLPHRWELAAGTARTANSNTRQAWLLESGCLKVVKITPV